MRLVCKVVLQSKLDTSEQRDLLPRNLQASSSTLAAGYVVKPPLLPDD